MKHFLIVEPVFWKKSYQTNSVTKEILGMCKTEVDCKIFDLNNGTYYDPKLNTWESIPNEKEEE